MKADFGAERDFVKQTTFAYWNTLPLVVMTSVGGPCSGLCRDDSLVSAVKFHYEECVALDI